ncbi:hypothetical protein DOK78_002990 [Enterococcus sp. DIV2402]|uniref:DUF1919 domain-containing protein n=1 Tax=Candidatus Enterococcus lowellii TaxID=2230877 RepID=A0ABZ2SRY2_9ENTE|nr:DUF1919 domain-containing protein [Enterococcus sp. DIV2402]MBO0465347.1 DUF1919 domain-containing protein [Enterococcus sp. DIV2402]
MLRKVTGKLKSLLRNTGNKYFSNFRRRKLIRKDFTIISNNCWAGNVYRYFGLPYNTPTVGLYMYPQDYLKFINNLKLYIETPISFIDITESKYKIELIKKGQNTIPIGKILDIEIMFLHYDNEEEALEKWNRRVQRINYDNIILKFSQMNGSTTQDLMSFDQTKGNFKKILFVKDEALAQKYESAIYFKGYENKKEITNDTTHFRRGLDLIRFLNR